MIPSSRNSQGFVETLPSQDFLNLIMYIIFTPVLQYLIDRDTQNK